MLLPSEMMEVDLPLESALLNTTHPSTPPRTENAVPSFGHPSRLPLMPTGNMDSTPKPTNSTVPPGTEPLSIKKKTSLRSNANGSPNLSRKSYIRNSPLSRTSARIVSPRRVSPQIRTSRMTVAGHHAGKSADAERILQLVETTKEDVGD